MASLGALVRRLLGPLERPVSDFYRAMFVSLPDLGRIIESWVAPKNILEIGCGEGALAEVLLERFPNAKFLGIDIIPHLGRQYSGPQEQVTFRQIRVEELAAKKPNQFDLIVINDVLHHVERGDRAGILEAAAVTLAPGGNLILKDWVRRPTPIHALVYIADAWIGGDRKVHYMSMAEQRSLIEEVFGKGAIQQEQTIRPWRQNHAFLVTRMMDAEPPQHADG